jgi:Tol biopolymer transport system component
MFFLGLAPSTRGTADDAEVRGGKILFNEQGSLYVIDVDGANRRKLADNTRIAALSPDGKLAAYADKDSVRVVPVCGGESSFLASISDGRVDAVEWSPDQKIVAYAVLVPNKSHDLFVVPYSVTGAGGAPRNMGHWYGGISFSPNGKFILEGAMNSANGGTQGSLETINVETGKREKLFVTSEMIAQAEYSPDGSYIAFMMTALGQETGADDDEPDCAGPESDLWILAKGSAKPVKIIDNVFEFRLSPDGNFVAIGTGTQDCGYPPGDGAVFVSSIDAQVQFKLSREAPSMQPRFSPDGKSVIFVDFNASQLMIGDLATRTLSPMSGSSVQGYRKLYDWK